MSTLSTCFFLPHWCIWQSPTPPQYVYWQKNDRMINYDDSRRDISIDTIPGLRTQSRLIIREPQIQDSGNYTCSASNTEPASIYVFVSKGNYAMSTHTILLMFKLLYIYMHCVWEQLNTGTTYIATRHTCLVPYTTDI